MTTFLNRGSTSRRGVMLCAPVMLLSLIALAACSGSGSSDRQPRTPDGTVTMSMAQAAFIGSGTAGSGTLHFQGRDFPFIVGALGAGGIGASTIRAQGEVYGLHDISQFPGTYGQARAGFALGTMSAGQLWLQNSNGVVLHLQAARQGLMLSLGADAFVINMSR